MRVIDLGVMEYRTAWQLQEQAHAQVLAGAEEQLLLVEHPPVITLGRRPGIGVHILASAQQRQARGVDVVHSDRGGDVTFHGPGQLVAYPIVRLASQGLSVSGYVHKLEAIIIAMLSDFGIQAYANPQAVGVWVAGHENAPPAKIAAIGVRIRRGVTLHGTAINVDNDLSFFNLIVPCGLDNRQVTSIAKQMTNSFPPETDSLMHLAKQKLVLRLLQAMA